jgi:hypothetical protein
MINRQTLLTDLQKLLQRIEADLLERSESTEVPEVPAALHAEYERAANAERTAQNYEDWRTDTITQAAAAWVLSCVFVRFLEDNSLIDPPKISGPGERLARARDEYELYFRSHPQHTDREYLLSIFEQLAALKGTKEIFGEHNAIRDLPNWISGDAAGELLKFFQTIEASSGVLVHDFTDRNWDTRFLGDLYQDLSEAARKKFALLQTPDFVEEFILDRTLEPAIEEFGLEQDIGLGNQSSLPGFDERNTLRIPFKMIDPACGSGHFLLGTFPRLLDRWQRKEPGTNVRELAQRALNSIHGVDINPFAVAIARFRLLLVAMKACDIRRLADAPAFRINVACGDSLLHGENRTSSGQKLWDYAEGATDEELFSHAYPGEDLQTVRVLLKPGTYHCVVANPPYIVPRDNKQNEWYRRRFSACHRQYSLAVPFMQQIFQLTTIGGFTGQITANSFMKREFGKKVIESFMPTIELTHVVDTSGAFIPGHGTPTVILFGRNRSPVCSTVRTSFGIRAEPNTPDDPSKGQVWSAIVSQLDSPGSQSDFISVADSMRHPFHKHPWSIGGGGAAELKTRIDSLMGPTLRDFVESIGFYQDTHADEAFVLPNDFPARMNIGHAFRSQIRGDNIRDWCAASTESIFFPYDSNLDQWNEIPKEPRWCWLYKMKTELWSRSTFGGGTYRTSGRKWFDYHQFPKDRARTPFSISFAFVASHNHFIFDRSGTVFNRSAPVVKLVKSATEDDHFLLLGYLNSSFAGFLMKQVSHQKQLVGGDGVRVESRAVVPYEFAGTQMLTIAVPESIKIGPLRDRLIVLTRKMDICAEKLSGLVPSKTLELENCNASEMRESWKRFQQERINIRAQMIILQEEIDFTVYKMWDLVDDSALSSKVEWEGVVLDAGDRPFSILKGRNEDGFSVPSNIPVHWPVDLQNLWRQRISQIQGSMELQLVEDSLYKRRWRGRQGLFNHTENQDELKLACLEWLTARLESYFDPEGRLKSNKQAISNCDQQLVSVAYLADLVRNDTRFLQIGELLRDDSAFDVQALVSEIVSVENVPHLPILSYKESGLRKRAEWEKTWELQRREDAGESVGTIPIPPKYISADFISTGGARYWSLRGKLDVPKERWISFPHCEGPDGTLVICWAGYDHLQQAQAISAYYVRVQTEFGGSDDPRLIPLLASLIELLPWLKQWHNEPNANFDGLRMGDYFEGFVNEEARNLGKTLAEIKAWVPPKKAAKTAAPKSSRKKTSKRKAAEEIEPS